MKQIPDLNNPLYCLLKMGITIGQFCYQKIGSQKAPGAIIFLAGEVLLSLVWLSKLERGWVCLLLMATLAAFGFVIFMFHSENTEAETDSLQVSFPTDEQGLLNSFVQILAVIPPVWPFAFGFTHWIVWPLLAAPKWLMLLLTPTMFFLPIAMLASFLIEQLAPVTIVCLGVSSIGITLMYMNIAGRTRERVEDKGKRLFPKVRVAA